jgi:hypothetical protein
MSFLNLFIVLKIFRNQTVENQHDVKDTDFDDELVFESLNLEEGFVGKMILSARRWTVFQLKKVVFFLFL